MGPEKDELVIPRDVIGWRVTCRSCGVRIAEGMTVPRLIEVSHCTIVNLWVDNTDHVKIDMLTHGLHPWEVQWLTKSTVNLASEDGEVSP